MMFDWMSCLIGSSIIQRRMKPSASGRAAAVVTGEKYLGRFLNCSQSTSKPLSPSQVITRLVTPAGVCSSGAVSVSHWLLWSRRKGCGMPGKRVSLFTVMMKRAITLPVADFSRMQNSVFSAALAFTTT